jgi:hypothetical protein
MILPQTEVTHQANYDFAAFSDQQLILHIFSIVIKEFFQNLLYENALKNSENKLEISDIL